MAVPFARLATPDRTKADCRLQTQAATKSKTPLQIAQHLLAFFKSNQTAQPSLQTVLNWEGIDCLESQALATNPTFPSPLKALAISRTERFSIMQKTIYVVPI